MNNSTVATTAQSCLPVFLRWHAVGLAAVSAMILGCSGGISGDYGGEDCLYGKMSFKKEGQVYITIMGMEQAAQYKVDGERVVVTGSDGRSMVFTKSGDSLRSPFLGETTVCDKL